MSWPRIENKFLYTISGSCVWPITNFNFFNVKPKDKVCPAQINQAVASRFEPDCQVVVESYLTNYVITFQWRLRLTLFTLPPWNANNVRELSSLASFYLWSFSTLSSSYTLWVKMTNTMTNFTYALAITNFSVTYDLVSAKITTLHELFTLFLNCPTFYLFTSNPM